MSTGDVGGQVSQLVIMCRPRDSDGAAIKKGDAVRLVGPYTVDNRASYGDRVFGQALADAEPGESVSVRVRGVCVFGYAIHHTDFSMAACSRVVMSDRAGKVAAFGENHRANTVLAVNQDKQTVDVLL